MHLMSWAASDVGQTRKANEDSYLVAPELGLVAVADGMGGYQRGDVASALACNVVREHVTDNRAVLDQYRDEPTDAHRDQVLEVLDQALQRACEEVHQAAGAILGEASRMGTTFDLLLVVGTTAFVAHVGDGRIYLFRGQEAHQITEDHTLVQQKLRDGEITPEQARTAEFKNVITRALGVYPSVLVDTLAFELDPQDRFILCSDGLYRYIGLRELGFTLSGQLTDQAASKLVALANERGGRDNITVVLATCDKDATGEMVAPTRERMEVLRKVDLFQTCTYRELIAVVQVAETKTVPRGEVLFNEGDAGRELFIVVGGEVAIVKGGTRLATVEEGDCFGEMSFVDTPKRSARAVALQDSRFLVIDRDRFMHLVKQDSELAAKVMWQLLRKMTRLVRKTSEKAASLDIDGLDIELV